MAVLNRDNAQTAQHFHPAASCAQTVTIGPRGGITYPRTELWRRNGATQVWKSRPTEYRIPVKHGMYAYGSLTHHDAWHTGTAEGCPDGVLAQSIADAHGTLPTYDVRSPQYRAYGPAGDPS